jgi:outer membrane receptor protein involved in Fe transport
LIRQDKEWKTLYPDYGIAFSDEENGVMAEAQHLWRLEKFSFTSGLGYFDADRKSLQAMAPFPTQVDETDISHTNFYTYANIHSPDHFTWTLGASGDLLKGAIVDKDQFNPKFGVMWNPYPATTLRAALFRTLQRTLLSSQTLEPTQVAGFNQFFNDGEGVDAWRYGVAADQKFSKNLYGGLELSRRDMAVPFEHFHTRQIREADWEERLVRAYLYWTPNNWMALSADYLYEDFERDSGDIDSPLFNKLETHRLPLGISFFHPDGFIIRFKTTYVNQEGQFNDPFKGIVPGEDQFWVVDAGIGYRLPKRFGMITLEAKNLFDKEFRFQDTDPANPSCLPGRLIVAKFTLSF